MDHQLAQFNSKMKSLEDKLAADLLAIKTKKESQIQSKNKKFTLKMNAVDKKEQTLAQMHEKEVLDIFEDHKTLDFINKMRGFKKSWMTDTEVKTRKQTAAQMAESTKNWISSYS